MSTEVATVLNIYLDDEDDTGVQAIKDLIKEGCITKETSMEFEYCYKGCWIFSKMITRYKDIKDISSSYEQKLRIHGGQAIFESAYYMELETYRPIAWFIGKM